MESPPPNNLRRRAEMLNSTRSFFREHGFLEVETPIRLPVPIPEAHIDLIVSEDRVLQPSPEICMKRMLAAGHEKIFQVCKCFRKAERGRRHLPEMTLLEWYAVGEDYTDLMADTEQLILHIAAGLGTAGLISYQRQPIDLTPPWERLTVAEAFDRWGALPVAESLAQGRFDEIMALEIEPHLGKARPVFLTDYPAEKASLARLKPADPGVAERFELYIGGLELCNGFSELNDPAEQRRRFETEQGTLQATGKRIYPLPEKFLDALTRMPSCAGNALGIDRLAMLFCDAGSIDEVVAFTEEEL
ncbi:MAG: EF-P lysine aminoacylase EpmA [Hyphomicrobiales bacterium]